jgi:outer membrane protein assembly complex protein YaeT
MRIASLVSLVGAIFTAVRCAPAQTIEANAFAGKTVTSIRYEPAVQPLDVRDLRRMQLVQVGRPFDSKQIAGTIDQLFSTGHYLDIQVDAEPDGAGVGLRFITRAQTYIGHVDVKGKIKDPPSRTVLISDAQLSLGTPFDEETLAAAKKNIEDELRQNGLFGAVVQASTKEDPADHQVTIHFEIQAGKRAKYEMPVISGDTKLSNEIILAATGWRIRFIHRWRQVTRSLTDKGVDGIGKKYAKKDRLTAVVDLTDMDYSQDTNRVKAHLNINGGPRITIHALEAKVSKGKLRQLVPVYEEGSVDNDLLAEGARSLSDYFQSKGYPDVDVTFKQEPLKQDLEVINFYIATGARRKLVRVNIEGNHYFLDRTIRERMFLAPATLVLRYGRYSSTFRSRDEETIENLYRQNGFRDVKVTSSVQSNFKGKARNIAVTFHINEGQQWRVAALTLQGPNQLDLSSIRQEFASVKGQPYAEVNIAGDRNRILQYYNSNGFPSPVFSYDVRPGDAPETVDLTYRIREGPRQFVRKVIVSGLERTHPSLVNRFLNLREGEPLSMIKVNEVARQLTDLGVFASVNTAVQQASGTERYKYVLYDFDEAARYTFNVGFGLEVGQFGGTTNNVSEAGGAKGVSPIVSFGVNRLNFLGLGQTLSFQTRYSSLEQRESIDYVVPRFLGSKNRTVTFSLLYDTTQDVQTFSSRRAEASVQTSQRLNRASTLLLRFAYRRVSTGNVQIPSLLIPQLLQAVRIGILSASYIQDHRDNPSDAHRGFWNTVDAGLTDKYFGSQRSFARLLVRNATYTPIGRKLVFARQTQFGAILPFSVPQGTTDADAVPLPERFFGGGGVSMRGFGDNQAGPRDIGVVSPTTGILTTPTGFPIGGNALFFNTFELRFPLFGPNISGVLFHDMGNIYTNLRDVSFAYRQSSDQDFNYAVQAVGFGVRYKTPFGPVRVDLAYSMNPPTYMGYSNSLSFQDLLQCGNGQSTDEKCQVSRQRLGHIQFFFSIGQAF